MRFSKRTLRLLRKAGWYPGRKIDVEDYELVLKKEGYEVTSELKSILREFGGLRVDYVYDPERGIRDQLIIDPKVPIRMFSSDLTQEWGRVLGLDLTPVGNCFRHDILVIDGSGRVLTAFDPYVDLIGETFDEAVENILRGKDMTYQRLLPKEDAHS